MIVLGLEGSANKLGCGIVDGSTILANPRITYVPPQGSGFLPAETARHHRTHVLDIIEAAFKECELRPSDIEAVAFTQGPGIASCLDSVAHVARSLSLAWHVPLIGVNHCVAHIEMGRAITGASNPVVIYASGGNTQIIAYQGDRYRIFGETIDIACGNCLDRVARSIGLSNDPTPGANVEKMALKGDTLFPLPYLVKGMDMLFAPLVDACVSLYDQGVSQEQICYSLQETAFAMLCEVTERALAHVGGDSVLLVGGVGCNLRLQEMVTQMADERGASVSAMDDRYCIDNGAMIAYTGHLMLEHGITTPVSASIVTQSFRTDEVAAVWRTS